MGLLQIGIGVERQEVAQALADGMPRQLAEDLYGSSMVSFLEGYFPDGDIGAPDPVDKLDLEACHVVQN